MGKMRREKTMLSAYIFITLEDLRSNGNVLISLETLDVNIGAQTVLEKCGFTLEGTERKSIYLNGSMHDRLGYSILKEEYTGNNP